MAKFDRRSCRIYDGVRDSKIHWDTISDFDRKIDSSNYGRVFPRSYEEDDNTGFRRVGQESQHSSTAWNGGRKTVLEVSSRRRKERVFPRTKVGELSSQLPNLTVDLPDFFGSSHMMEVWNWVDLVDDYFKENSYPEHIQYKIATCKLKGDARVWLEILQNDRDLDGVSQINSWSELSDLLVCRYPHTTCLSEVCNKWISKLKNVEKGTVLHADCSTKCPNEKKSPKQSEDSSPSDSSHCVDVILETPINETVEEINYILEPGNCEENNNDDDLDESFVEQQSEKIVKLKPAACSTKVRLESDIETLEKTTSHLLMPTNGHVPIVSLSVITSVGFSKALNISDHMGNELFYEFGRVDCKHFDPGGIRQDMMLWFSLANFSHGPVKIVEMEQEEIIMPEGFDPNSMGLEHIAFDISHDQLHIHAKGVTEQKIRAEHEDTYTIRAVNSGPQVMSVKLPDSKTLMLGSLANSLIGIRSFILVDEMLTLSFDPGGITKSGVLCPIRVHECRTNHALPRICDWSFDPGGLGQSRTNICRVLGCVMQAEQIFKGVEDVYNTSVVKLSLDSFSLCICLRESGVFNCMHISARQKLMNVDSQLDNSSNHINGLDVATEGSIVGWEPNVYGTNKQFLLSKYFPKVHILTMRFLFDPGGSAESHNLVDHLSSSSDMPLLKSDTSKDEIGGPYSEKATFGLEVLYPNYMVHIFASLGLAPVWKFCTDKPIYKREVWIQHCLNSMKSAISALFVRCLSMTHVEAVISDKKLLAYTLEHVSRIWRADYTVNRSSTCFRYDGRRINSNNTGNHVQKRAFNANPPQSAPSYLILIDMMVILKFTHVQMQQAFASEFSALWRDGQPLFQLKNGTSIYSIVLRECRCALDEYIRTRGRVIRWEGWNDANDSKYQGTFSMARRSIVGKNGQNRKLLKLFSKTVNGLDPPAHMKAKMVGFVWTLKSSLVDELSVWGDGLM